MKCVILAAGASTRLRPLTDELPKCLLPVGSKTILERTIENVLSAGIPRIGIVVGFKAAVVRSFVKHRYPSERIRFIVNPRYESTNNGFSLLLSREFHFSEKRKGYPLQPLLILDGDILFSNKLLPHLIGKTDKAGETDRNRIAVRVEGPHDAEEVGVEVNDRNEVRKIGKNLPPDRTFGESIGMEFFVPSTAEELFATLERGVRVGEGRTDFYEASFQEMIETGTVMEAVDVSRFPATEIDTFEDLEFARNTILPAIDLP